MRTRVANSRQRKGELTITKYDADAGALTGTFWFDAVDNAGNKYEIRDGKFAP
ncbi:hypothetical protein [Mucilaginibacter sp.]